MRRISFAGLFVSLVAASSSFESAFAAPGADVYGRPPDISEPTISPDGNYIAMIQPLGDTGGVRIAKIGGTSCGFAPANVKIRNVFWANSDRLAVQVSFTHSFDNAESTLNRSFEIFRYVTVDKNCGTPAQLLTDHRYINNQSGVEYVGRLEGGKYLLFRVLNMRMSTKWSNIKGHEVSSRDVYKVDSTTGTSELYEAALPRTVRMIADASGKIRIRVDQDERSRRKVVSVRMEGSTDWQQVYDSDSVNDPSRLISFIAVGTKPNTAYVGTRNGGDKEGVFEFDFQSKAVARLVFQNPRVDFDDVIVDEYSDRPVGVAYTDDYPSAEYFDRAYAQMQADIASTFPGEHVRIVSVSADAKKIIAFSEGVQNPTGGYHLIDLNVPEMSPIGARYAAIGASDVGAVKSFSYPSRDGLTIPAYLTLPSNSPGKKLPLVVMPHGGPADRDSASFNAWTQFLASRGYAVLQPQFRGSRGFGAQLEDAGHFKWGLEMQNDITDGVKYLTANGTADPTKVCIFGASYGGYAAMAGLAFTPDLYKCGISVGGVSDLLTFVGDLSLRTAYVEGDGDTWREFVGDATTDRERLIATSPYKQVSKITAPLLLMHGKADTIVPFRHSQMMADALKEAGKPVELIALEGEDHWLSKASMRQRVLREVELFLAKYLK